MMKKFNKLNVATKLSLLLVTILIVIFLYEAVLPSNDINNQQNNTEQTVQTTQSSALFNNGTIINLWVADKITERQVGLSTHTEMPQNQGMLFVFNKTHTHEFWMKKMSFPIDILWIKDNTILDITENAQPEPYTPEEDLTKYTPTEPVDKVLEVNAGFVESNGGKDSLINTRVQLNI